MTSGTFARALPRSTVSPAEWPVSRVLAAVGHFFAVSFEIFAEAKEEARKAHEKYPFAE